MFCVCIKLYLNLLTGDVCHYEGQFDVCAWEHWPCSPIILSGFQAHKLNVVNQANTIGLVNSHAV